MAVFCGCDTTDRHHALFEKVSGPLFKTQSAALQQQNPVYATHEFDEKAVDSWPKDGTPPKVLLECCVHMADISTSNLDNAGTTMDQENKHAYFAFVECVEKTHQRRTKNQQLRPGRFCANVPKHLTFQRKRIL